MIATDIELQTTLDRIAYFHRLLAQLRVTSSPEVFPAMASGYRMQIERMHHDVLDYLTRHASEFHPARVA
jgi:hypothetical protein